MIAENFTIGVYEDRWIYVRFLADAVHRKLQTLALDRAWIIWYRLNEELSHWTDQVAQRINSKQDWPNTPFGKLPYLIEITNGDYRLPGDVEKLNFEGQKDIPRNLVSTSGIKPGMFYEIQVMDECPDANLFVVDHELFHRDTAEASRSTGCAHLIARGLQKYYGHKDNTPPIFLSSYYPLSGETGLDTLGMGRGQRTRISWFPRPTEKPPKNLPDGFEQALQEEMIFWFRNRELLGVKYGRSRWQGYDPPFDHVLVYCDEELQPSEDKIPRDIKVVFREEALTINEDAREQISDDSLARHCKAYIEIRKEVDQDDVSRLRTLARDLPLPIVLLYKDTARNVSNLVDCGVLTHLIGQNKSTTPESAAVEWLTRMDALDTVVGGRRLREIRDDLTRWCLSTPEATAAEKAPTARQGILVIGPTGAGKTGVSKWCHFYSNHVTKNDTSVDDLWKQIIVPDPDPQKEGHVVPLGVACARTSKEFLVTWAKMILAHSRTPETDNTNVPGMMRKAFKANRLRPWQLNLVGVTRHDEFVMQMAGAYPSWTGTKWPYGWRSGAILDATNSSLILNEIGELESEAQGLLLELIERDGPVRPMFSPIGGDVKARNVLFIMATDRADRIRSQLLHRCRIVRVPSLLECQEDISELARHRLLPRWRCLSERADQILMAWPYWPGNHRSLHSVLDFASERLSANRRVIRVTDLLRAFWRDNLFVIPTRLEILTRWILDWPQLDTDPVENVIPAVAEHLTRIAVTDDGSLMDYLTRISEMTFENPSAHFSDLLQLNEQREKLGKLRSVMQETKLARGDELYQQAADVAAQDLGNSISLANLAVRPNITINFLTDLLQSLEDKGATAAGSAQHLRDIKYLLLKVLRLYVHEIFWTVEKRTSRVRRAIAAAKSAPKKKPLELPSDQEERLVTGLRDDALIILSLGTLLWKVVHVEPKDIAEANKLILTRPTKPSGRRKEKPDSSEPPPTNQGTETSTSSRSEDLPSKADKPTRKNQIPSYGDSKISTTAKDAGQYALAIIKAVDDRTRHGLFDYSEDRRSRAYFGQGLEMDDEDDEDDE